jgi:hypothetical protein
MEDSKSTGSGEVVVSSIKRMKQEWTQDQPGAWSKRLIGSVASVGRKPPERIEKKKNRAKADTGGRVRNVPRQWEKPC